MSENSITHNDSNKLFNWIRKHFSVSLTNKLALVVILIYYYIGLLSYITASIPEVHSLFTVNSVLEIVLRAIITIMIVVYCLIVLIVYKYTPPWRYAIILLFVLLFTLFSSLISPTAYKLISISRDNVIHLSYISSSVSQSLIMFLSSLADFALGFCFLFILPLVVKDIKQMLILLLPIIVIGIIECIYSLIKDNAEYIKLFNLVAPEYGGYNVRISASFGDKQNWGLFLSVCFTCSILSMVMVRFAKRNITIISRVILGLLTIMFYIFTIMCLCKTAIVGETFCLILVAICLIFYLFKKHKKITGIIYTSILVTLVTFILLFYLVPAFHSDGILKTIYDITTKYIFDNISEDSIWTRTQIWVNYADKIPSYNFIFGLGKQASRVYSMITNYGSNTSIHNGIANIFAFYGIIGLSVYAILLVLVIINIIKVHKYKPTYCYVMLGLFLLTMCSSLLEANVLVLSGSNLVFIFNIVLVSFPAGILIKERNKLTYEK